MDFRGFHLCCMCVPHAFSLVFTAAQWGTAPYNFWYNYVCLGSLAARWVICHFNFLERFVFALCLATLFEFAWFTLLIIL